MANFPSPCELCKQPARFEVRYFSKVFIGMQQTPGVQQQLIETHCVCSVKCLVQWAIAFGIGRSHSLLQKMLSVLPKKVG
jgi:hypothetical protein